MIAGPSKPPEKDTKSSISPASHATAKDPPLDIENQKPKIPYDIKLKTSKKNTIRKYTVHNKTNRTQVIQLEFTYDVSRPPNCRLPFGKVEVKVYAQKFLDVIYLFKLDPNKPWGNFTNSLRVIYDES